MGNRHGSTTGKRKGPKVRFPRFKGKRARLSCRFITGAFGLAEDDRGHVKLPRIGVIRTHESTRKLARHVERGSARIRSATITHQRGRWFCSFSVEIDRNDPAPARPQFFKTLRTWTADHQYGNVTTEQFRALAEETSGKDLGALFTTWLYTAGKPAVGPNGPTTAGRSGVEPRSFRAIHETHQMLAHSGHGHS